MPLGEEVGQGTRHADAGLGGEPPPFPALVRLQEDPLPRGVSPSWAEVSGGLLRPDEVRLLVSPGGCSPPGLVGLVPGGSGGWGGGEVAGFDGRYEGGPGGVVEGEGGAVGVFAVTDGDDAGESGGHLDAVSAVVAAVAALDPHRGGEAVVSHSRSTLP